MLSRTTLFDEWINDLILGIQKSIMASVGTFAAVQILLAVAGFEVLGPDAGRNSFVFSRTFFAFTTYCSQRLLQPLQKTASGSIPILSWRVPQKEFVFLVFITSNSSTKVMLKINRICLRQHFRKALESNFPILILESAEIATIRVILTCMHLCSLSWSHSHSFLP